jgi:hypothetical protein
VGLRDSAACVFLFCHSMFHKGVGGWGDMNSFNCNDQKDAMEYHVDFVLSAVRRM